MERFTLEPRTGLSRIALFGAASAALVIASVAERGIGVPLAAVVMIFGLAFVPLLVAVAVGSPSGRRFVEVLDDRLHIPYGARALRMIVVRYTEIDALHLQLHRRGSLILATPYARVRIPRSWFESEGDAERLHALIRAKVQLIVPNGEARAARLDEASAAAHLAESTPPRATVGAIVALVLGHGVAHLLGGFERLYAMVAVGAGARVLVEEGQWFRVVSANLLHSSLFHLAIIAALIFVFGRRVEQMFGARHTLLVMLASLIAGGVASAVSMGDVVFMGAQPVACGVLGSAAFVTTKYRTRLPHALRAGPSWWILSVSLALFLLIVSPFLQGSDVPGQLGGLLAGVVVTALVLLRGDPGLPVRETPIGVTAAAFVLLLAIAGAAGASGVRAMSDGAADETRVIRYHLDNSVGDRTMLNRIAWEIATDPDAPSERIALARVASERSLERLKIPEVRAAYEDTYATVLYRLGEHAAAAEHEMVALALRDDPFMATQLARFLAANDDVLRLHGAAAGDVRIETVEHDVRGFGIQLQGVTATTATTLYALAKKGGQLQGLLRLTVDADVPTGETIWLEKRGAPASWPPGTTLEPAAYDFGDGGWRAWSADSEALELP